MAVQADYNTLAQKVYVAYFGRPADALGLSNMTAQLLAAAVPVTGVAAADTTAFVNAYSTNTTIKSIVDNFGLSTESLALYGDSTTSNAAFVNSIYLNVLGRGPLLAGLTFWSNALTTGAMTRGEAALRIMEGALTNTTAQGLLDADTVTNRVTAAQTFSDNQLTVEDVLGYSGATAAATARTWLSTVTSDAATLTAATASVATTITSINTATAATAAVGTTFTLTTSADTGTAFTGTANNDTFVATNGTTATLNAGDVLAGGAGTDTLSVSFSGAPAATSAVTMTGIENISISNYATGGTPSIDLSQATGVASLAVTASASTGDTTITGLGGIVTAAMSSGSGDLNVTYTDAAVTGTADSQTLTLSGQTAGSFSVAGATTGGVETLNIVSNTSANTIAVNDAATATITTINVSGASNLALTEGATNADDAVTAINAGTFTGNLTVTTGSAAQDMSITGGTGNDTITLGNFTSADSVDGGTGTDSLSIAVTVASVAALANVAGIETLKLTGGADLTLAANVVPTTFTVSDAGVSIVTLNTGYTAATTVNMGAGDKVDNVANVVLTANAAAANLETADATSVFGGTGADTINITADTNSPAVITMAGLITAVETITIVDGGDVAATTAGKDISLTTGAYATSLTIDASALDQGATTALGETLTVDGSLAIASKVLNITGGAGNDTITGGLGNDIISTGLGDDSINGGGAASDSADSINAGDGNDTINMGAHLTSADTIDGGAGTDTLSVTSLSASGLTNVTNVETLSLSGSGSTATLTANLSFTTIDMSTVDNTAQTLTLSTGYTNATTVSVDAGDKVANSANVALTVNVTAADMETADATTITGGTGADTINITADAQAPAAITMAGLITLVDTITIVDGGNDASTGDNPAGDDVSLTTGAYATALTINGTAMSAGTLTGTTMNADYENLTVDATGMTKNLTVTGGSGVNNITMGAGNDVITGGAGNDAFVAAGAGNDTINTGAGTNTIDMSTYLTYQDTITGGAGTDTLTVSGAVTDVQFMATTLINTLTLDNTAALASFAQAAGITKVNVSGANAVDASGMTTGVTFVATAGGSAVATSVSGGTGNDTFQFNGTSLDSATSVDSLNGGSGTDAVFLDNSAAGVTGKLDLDAVIGVETITLGTASGLAASSTELVALTIDALTLTTAQTITIDGSVITDSDDTIAITNNASTTTTKFSITGGAGNDTLAGSSAADTISGGAGADSITGSVGADNLTGGADADTDTFAYTLANSEATVAAADTITDFVTGTDKISMTVAVAGGGVLDATNKGTAASNAEGLALLSSKIGQYYFNTGTSQLIMDTDGSGLIQATDLAITMTGLTSAGAGDVNFVVTAAGAGTITTGGGADSITVIAAGNVIVTAGAGNDTIYATQAQLDNSDSIHGGADTDTLSIAGTGATTLSVNVDFTGVENITFSSDTHDLTLTNQTEAFNITTANGTNNIVMAAGALAHTVTGGTGADTVTFATQADFAAHGSLVGGASTDVLVVAADSTAFIDADFARIATFETILLGGAANTLVLGTNATAAGITTVIAGTGATTVTSTQTALAVDLTAGTAAATSFVTGAATANYTVTGDVLTTAYTATGSSGTLNITSANAGANAVAIAAGTGSITVSGGDATDTITVTGMAGTQNFTSTATSIISLTATAGNHVITTGAGADVIVGGTGNDTINAGTGMDSITSGTGSDVILINAAGNLNSTALVVVDGAVAGSIAATDTIALTAACDKVVDFTTLTDKVNLAAFALTGAAASLTTTVATALDQIANGQYILIYGTYAGTTLTVTASGAATHTALFYDADTTGGVDTEVILLTGVAVTGDLTLA